MPRANQRKARIRRRLLVALGLLLVGLCAYEGLYAVRIWQLRATNPTRSAFMVERLAVLRQQHRQPQLAQHWVAYRQIAPALKYAVIAGEDARFVHHIGFDMDGIERAVEENLRAGSIVAGGSTITQQLAKNLYLSPDRSWLRKGQEAVLTVMLESMLSKRRILEIYLNVIEWGNGVFGADAAAHHYFGLDASRLDARRAAWLAAIIPDPRYYDRHGVTPGLAARAEVILKRMSQVQVP